MKTDLFINPTKSNYSLWNACRSWSRRSRKSRRFPDLNHTLWPLSLEWHSQAIYCSPLGVLLRKIFGFILSRQVCTQTRSTDMPDTCQVISLRILWNRTYFLRKIFFSALTIPLTICTWIPNWKWISRRNKPPPPKNKLSRCTMSSAPKLNCWFSSSRKMCRKIRFRYNIVT